MHAFCVRKKAGPFVRPLNLVLCAYVGDCRMPIAQHDFTIRVVGENPHRPGTDLWRAGRIVEAMEGCDVPLIVDALTCFEKNRTKGVADPARWLSDFAGLESAASNKGQKPWIEIIHSGQLVSSTASYRELLRGGT